MLEIYHQHVAPECKPVFVDRQRTNCHEQLRDMHEAMPHLPQIVAKSFHSVAYTADIPGTIIQQKYVI